MPFPDPADSSEPDHNSAESGRKVPPVHSSQPPAGGAPRAGQASDPELPKPPINTGTGDPLVDLPDPQPPPPEPPHQPNPRFILRRLFAGWLEWTVIVVITLILTDSSTTGTWLAMHGGFAAIEIVGLAFFGTTPGRRVVGLRVRSTSLKPLGLWRSALRYVIKDSPLLATTAVVSLLPASANQEAIIDGVSVLGFYALLLYVFLPVVTGTDGQGQHDLLAETMTVAKYHSTSSAPLLDRYRQTSRHIFENKALGEDEVSPPSDDGVWEGADEPTGLLPDESRSEYREPEPGSDAVQAD